MTRGCEKLPPVSPAWSVRCASCVAKPLRSTSFCSTCERSDRYLVERTSVASALITRVEVALLQGRNLEQIETELRTESRVDEDEQAAVWLYARSRGAGSAAQMSG